MKNKIRFMAFLMLSLVVTIHGYAAVCKCGSHATGITTYFTTSSGCCSGSVSPTLNGFVNSYEQDEGGTWTMTNQESISSAEGQANCCG